MATDRVRVSLVGTFTKEVTTACLIALQSAGMVPDVMLRIGRRRTILIGPDASRPLFVKWTGRKSPQVSWTLDPQLFSANCKRDGLRAMAELLADPASPRSTLLIPRGKTSSMVS